jgi:hypothetical protein
MTQSGGTLEKREIFSLMRAATAASVRHRRMSGWMPISRSSFTECCVGLVLSSPAAPIQGTRVTCTLMALVGPTSSLSCRMASRKGSDSMSPTVPPISTMATSTPSVASRTRALISSVMCGITCTVAPRYSPRRSLEITDW